MNKKKVLCLVLAVTTLLSVASGCGKKAAKEAAFESDMPKGVVSYPIKTDEKLTYWCELPGAIATDVTNFGETNFAKDLAEKTGIEIEWKHPAAGTTAEALQLMMASGKMTDMIQASWLALGPQAYVDNKQIYALDGILEDYAPNLNKYLEEHEDIQKMVKTDSGSYYAFPFIRGDEMLLISMGFMLRSDWLKEDGLEVPETIEDWDAVLEAFKKRCPTPFAMSQFSNFSGGFDTFFGAYIKDGKIVYGPTEDNFKAFLAKMNEWYNKGYMDKNYAVTDSKTNNANLLNGKAGITYSSGGGGMGTYLNEMKGKAFDLSATPYPTHKKGEPAKFGNKELPYGLGAVAITTSCKNPALAARFLDYGYSEEGHMTYNFGKEGSSYNMVDGYPTYVEEIKANPEGKSMSQMLAHNCLAGVYGPFVQDKKYLEQYYGTDQQREAVKMWSSCKMEDYKIPQVILTTEENDRYTAIMGEINTYVNEMYNNFITGKESLDNFDKFVKEIKDMGIDEANEIQQAAYNRFLKR